MSVGTLHLNRFRLELGRRTFVMGVLNVTPDSFSDGGLFLDPGRAVEYAHRMVEEGADLIDIGGESTRPGALPVPVEEELRRVLPVVRTLTKELSVPISVDTYKAEVAEAVLACGADLINDIGGLRLDPRMASVVAKARAGLVIMHMKGTPRTMQHNPTYEDLMGEILAFLKRQVERAEEAGIDPSAILVDPGLGFGKRPEHNLIILQRLKELQLLGKPILIGPSRKAFIGHVLGLPVEDRLEGTLACGAAAVWNGAHVIRVHDVKPMARLVRMLDAIRGT
ncbi:MAG: dihydropteroate synthase [Candidatus Methylomirabilales bacterium]